MYVCYSVETHDTINLTYHSEPTTGGPDDGLPPHFLRAGGARQPACGEVINDLGIYTYTYIHI
jgi:hypothetical protein